MPKPIKKDYVEVVYNEKDRPFTRYPNQLSRYLFQKYEMVPGQKIVDVGCGRGEFLNGFIQCGLHGYGVDQSIVANTICPDGEITQSDLLHESLPYPDSTFDVVYSKSVLEHFYYPENLVQEFYRVVKPGGLIITMVPDWEAVYKTFYEDYTHRTPFTLDSLRDILLIHGFEQVMVHKFRQLPFLWSLPWLWPFLTFIAWVTPIRLSKHTKLTRFSREIMLLSSAVKPVQ